MESEHGCTVAYERHEVAGPATGEAMLAHGFMRKLENMRGWAKLLAGEGTSVTLISFCNSSWLNGHHRRNADDLIALRKHLKLDKVVYAGFSAGGLAAYIAAGQDRGAAAYLGLDSVDSGDLAISMQEPLAVPALFVVGEPSMCNARGNFNPVFERWPQYQVTSIRGASHCHFELPYDKRCGWLCGGASDSAALNIQQQIQDVATGWLREH
jgi:pimeloyl-ACP methyl ester carboxylesterase